MRLLTPRLTLEQACATSHRETLILEQQARPPRGVVENILHTASTLYEPYLDLVGGANLTSFWRGPILNQHVGGAKNSLHMVGLAFDSIPTKLRLVPTLVKLSLSNLPYENALIEWGWIHISAPRIGAWPQRKMTMSFGERDSKGNLIVHAFDPNDKRLEKYA